MSRMSLTRGFVAAVSALALATSVAAVTARASDYVSFPSAMLDGPDPNGVTVTGDLFLPGGPPPYAAVILLPHCGGADSANVQDIWPDFLTDEGYAVLTVDTFRPQGQSECVGLNRIDSRAAQARFGYGALDYLVSRGDIRADRIAVMGFSEGAASINNFITPRSSERKRTNEFAAAVSAYGQCSKLHEHGPNDIPLMVIAPEYDIRLAPACIRVATGSGHIYLTYLADAYHGFDNVGMRKLKHDDAGNAMQYSAAATSDAKEATARFLDGFIGANAGNPPKREIRMNGSATRGFIAGWIGENVERLCQMDADGFADEVDDLIDDLKDDDKIIEDFAISPFKMKRLRKDACTG